MKPARFVSALLVATALPAMAQVVIVSAKNPLTKLTKDYVSQLYLGQTQKFHTGAQAVPIDQSEGSPLWKSFCQQVVGKSPAQMKAHWAKMSFSGTAQPPKVLGTSAEVVKLVAENPKYVGYVDKAAVTPDVKVVFTLD